MIKLKNQLFTPEFRESAIKLTLDSDQPTSKNN